MRPFKKLCLITTGLSLAVFAQPAFAQTTFNDVDEIIVTAPLRQAYQGDFTQLEIPQAELEINAQVLSDANVTDLVSALDLSASVSRQNNFGGLWNAFAVRGFVGDENLPSLYLVNGFNAGRGFAGPRDISGIESVEVLKGPKGALFGRGEPGGTVNLVTKRPTFETGGYVNLTAGSFDFYRADADFTTPVSDDLAVRLVGFYEDAGSFRETIETERWGFFPSVAYTPSERTQLVYELELSGQDIPFDRGIPAINNELGDVDIRTFLGEPSDGAYDASVTGHQLELQHDFNDNWSALVGFNYRDTSLEGFDTAATLSGFRQFLTQPIANGGNREILSRERRFRDYDAEYFVFRGEVAGEFDTGGLRHRVLIGADYDEFDNDQVFIRFRGQGVLGRLPEDAPDLLPINIFDPVFGQFDPLPEPDVFLADRLETTTSFGIFFQDQISLTDRLDVRVGFRYDDVSQDLDNRANNTQAEASDSRFSPQVGAVYEVNDNLSVYASYGENFRPFNLADTAGTEIDANVSTAIEAGINFQLFDGALQGTATLFQVEQDNILAVDDDFIAIPVGEAQSRGFEFDLNGQITDTIDFWLSYAYTDVGTENEFSDPNFGATIPEGTRLINVAENQLSVQVAKDFTDHGLPLRAGGGLLYVGERLGQFGDFFGLDQEFGEFELPSYVTVRAFLDLNITDEISARLDVDNIFNEDIFLNSFSALWVQPGAPRNFKVSLAYKF